VPVAPALPVVPPVVLPEPPEPVEPPVPPLSTQVLFVQCAVEPHACPQLPQFASLLVVSMQAVPHAISGLTQPDVQALLLHSWPFVHVVVQVPQWSAFDCTQRPLHISMPAAHWHWPF
jgi:hypothetical protein